MKVRLTKGSRVRAFHPQMFGVIKEGTVVRVGSAYCQIDFGDLLGGARKVPLRHVTEVVELAPVTEPAKSAD